MDPYEFVLMQYENARQKSSNPTDFNNKYGHAYEHYIYQGDPGTDWQDEVFGTHPVASYLDLSVNTNNPLPLAIAQVIKVAAMHRVTDAYGPIPYLF